MSTITREQAQKIIDAADEVITALAGTNEDVHPEDSRKMCDLWDDLNDRYAPPEVVRELARIAMASLEADKGAEPVAKVETVGICWYADNGVPRKPAVGTELFAAPPAPASDYPETLPCPVILEPGLRFGKGVKTHTMLEALKRRAEYYAEMEAMTPEQRAEHEAGMREFTAMLQGGKS